MGLRHTFYPDEDLPGSPSTHLPSQELLILLGPPTCYLAVWLLVSVQYDHICAPRQRHQALS